MTEMDLFKFLVNNGLLTEGECRALSIRIDIDEDGGLILTGDKCGFVYLAEAITLVALAKNRTHSHLDYDQFFFNDSSEPYKQLIIEKDTDSCCGRQNVLWYQKKESQAT
jgi:hypothetical protein